MNQDHPGVPVTVAVILCHHVNLITIYTSSPFPVKRWHFSYVNADFTELHFCPSMSRFNSLYFIIHTLLPSHSHSSLNCYHAILTHYVTALCLLSPAIVSKQFQFHIHPVFLNSCDVVSCHFLSLLAVFYCCATYN